MIDISAAKRALKTVDDRHEGIANYFILNQFINDVEELLKNNSIKQTPRLFEPYKDEENKT